MAASPYLPNTDDDRKEMLKAIGAGSVEELFNDIPRKFRNADFNLPAPLSELELMEEFRRLSELNASAEGHPCFLGAGYYHHFIPGVVAHLTGRSEFYTAYTPYQPEISQGTLQSLYEFQSMVSELMGMDVSNAGMYDGSTAAAEAALMACRVTSRAKIVVLSTVNPGYLDVIHTYTGGHDIPLEKIPSDGQGVPSDAACLIVQQPNFFGYLEDLKTLGEKAHSAGALFIVVANPISLGMLRTPGEYGADIAVAEGQALGNPMCFGGPGVGIFTCRKEYLRQMPGRLVGKTVDLNGRPGYVLTLATREQHIRREKATSNICTSEALVAIAVAVYLAALGRRGLRQVAELCYHKAHYAASQIAKLKGYSIAFEKPFFHEFVVRCPVSPSEINKALIRNGIIGGLDIDSMVKGGMLLCVTEMNTRKDIDRLVQIMGKF